MMPLWSLMRIQADLSVPFRNRLRAFIDPGSWTASGHRARKSSSLLQPRMGS